MARRIPLPRLTQRQRTARWQRERRQQAIVVVVFSTILFFVLGLSAWAWADRFYTANLKPAATYAGRLIPTRDYQRELGFQLVKFYVDFGVPKGFENDPQITSRKAQYNGIALDAVLEQAALDKAARDSGVTLTAQQIDARYAEDFGEYRSRHILITADAQATDKDAADKAALKTAQDIAAQLKAKPDDQELWNTLAKEKSQDPGSKDSGGELGFVGKGGFVKEYEEAAKKLAIGEVSDPVKSTFGYHIIQVRERHGPEASDTVQRYLTSGFPAADIKLHTRYDLLKDEFTKRALADAARSPGEQIHLAKILVSTPAPTANDLASFTAGLRKISEVSAEIAKGTDFAEIAKKLSDDPTADKGGDIGWVTRGMLTDLKAEDELFKLDAGTVSHQFATRVETVFYKVLEKAASREITEDQKKIITDGAYQYWLNRQERDNDARKLVPGFELG